MFAKKKVKTESRKGFLVMFHRHQTHIQNSPQVSENFEHFKIIEAPMGSNMS